MKNVLNSIVFKFLLITLKLGLGGMMVYGGIGKFTKPIPQVTEMILLENADKKDLLDEPEKLKIKNYVFGMKQTGYAWQVLGIFEIIGGLLLLSQLFSLIGSFILLPITLHIFLFHLFLEQHEIGELILVSLYFILNLLFIGLEYKKLKPLFKIKVW